MKISLWRKIRQYMAGFFIVVMIIQNSFFSFADIQNSSGNDAISREEMFASSENISFISFPCRFEDQIPEGYEEQYYIFSIESLSDLTITVEFESSHTPFGAELLDSSFLRQGISENRNSQRIIKREASPGTYFLRVFPLEDTGESEAFTVSVQRMDLSSQAINETDFSELHMVAALQGTGSPYKMNGTNPYYSYMRYNNWTGITGYLWYENQEPVFVGRGVDSGGIYPIPQHYFSSWMGPVDEDVLSMADVRDKRAEESEEDYVRYLQEDAIAYKGEENALIHVQNGIALPPRFSYLDHGNEEENAGWDTHLKNAVMTYGAVTTGIYWNNLLCEKPENYYFSGWDLGIVNTADGGTGYALVNSFGIGEEVYLNHEVDIVGWDDNYPRENFRYSLPYPLATIVEGEYEDELETTVGYSLLLEATASQGIYEDEELPAVNKRASIASSSEDSYETEDEEIILDDRPGGIRTATMSEEVSDEDSQMDEFLKSLLPETDGAWIVRNSWGESAGEDGYYYVSYCDRRIVSNDHSWAYAATETTDNYNKMYVTADLPYSAEYTWETTADMLMASTVFTADGDSTDVLKAVSFDLINNNVKYEIAVNLGDDIGKGWIQDNVCASGSKMYAGYYTVRLDKSIFLEPGEQFEIILRIEGNGEETLALPWIQNTRLVANLPRQSDLCRLYDPAETDWIDIGNGFSPDNGSNNYYAYFTTKALCYDASLEEGKIEKVSMLDVDPDRYYALADINEIGEAEDFSAATPSESGSTKDGHPLQKRTSSAFLGTGQMEEIKTVLPESFDLREEGALTPIRDQRYTNTCWSFGSTAAVESSYLLNGRNLYNYNYSSGIRLDTDLQVLSDGKVIYYFDKTDPDTMDEAMFTPTLLAWDDGPLEDEEGKLRWEISGNTSSVDMTEFYAATDDTGLTGNGEETLLFTPVRSGVVTVRVSSADDPTKAAVCQVVLVEENSVDQITVSPENMMLRKGDSRQLEVEIQGDLDQDITPVFTSDAPDIASVDDNGTVLGLKRGTTVIRVRAGDKEASCTVTVWERSSDRDSSSSSSSGDPGLQAVHGSWVQLEDGSWQFWADGILYRDTWGYLYNPYGNQGTGDIGWYRFDAEGKMLTGWFQDKDGYWYYLNPVSDGNKGKMAADTTTPDGYYVDSQGRWIEAGDN